MQVLFSQPEIFLGGHFDEFPQQIAAKHVMTIVYMSGIYVAAEFEMH